jgi:urea transport system permease protein
MLNQSIALIQLKSEDAEAQIAAAKTLGSMGSIAAQDALKSLARESSSKPAVVDCCQWCAGGYRKAS